MGPCCLGLILSTATFKLCDLEGVSQPVWTQFSYKYNEDKDSSYHIVP